MPKIYNLLSIEIAEYIEQYIQQNNLKFGDKLPTERELAVSLDVTRVTLRHGLQLLIDSGIIYRKKNSGYFVCNTKVKRELINYCFLMKDSLLKETNYTIKPVEFIPESMVNIGTNVLQASNLSELELRKFLESVDDIPIGLTYTMQKKSSLEAFPKLFSSTISYDDIIITQSFRIYNESPDIPLYFKLLNLKDTDSILFIYNFIYSNDIIIAASLSVCVGTRVDLVSDISLK